MASMISTGGFRQVAFAGSFARKPILFSGDGFLNRITRFQPFINRGWADAIGSASRRSIRVVHTVNRDGAQIALVLGGLLQRCSPTAIARLIVSVGIQPINRVIQRRADTHVVQERHKRRLPTLTHPDPTASIFREVLVGSVFAPRFHTNPNTIRWASFATKFVAVLQSAVRVSHSYLNSRCPMKCKGWLA